MSGLVTIVWEHDGLHLELENRLAFEDDGTAVVEFWVGRSKRDNYCQLTVEQVRDLITVLQRLTDPKAVAVERERVREIRGGFEDESEDEE